MPANTITVSTSPTVLIGSSSSTTTDYLAAILESWRYQIEVARNGTDALARIDSVSPPSIALLDMDLASPSAAEVVWEVRRRQEQLGERSDRTVGCSAGLTITSFSRPARSISTTTN